MITTLRFVVLTAVVLLAPATVAAQTGGRWLLGGGVGASSIWSDDSRLGTGVLAEGRIGWYLTAKTQLEMNVTRLPYERHFDSGVRREGRSLFTTFGIKHNFMRRLVSPFVLAGYGIDRRRQSGTDQYFGDYEDSSTTHGAVVGAGVVINRGRWEIGPEARAYSGRDSVLPRALTLSVRASRRF